MFTGAILDLRLMINQDYFSHIVRYISGLRICSDFFLDRDSSEPDLEISSESLSDLSTGLTFCLN